MTLEKLRDEDQRGPFDSSYVLGMHVESPEFFAALAAGELESIAYPESIPEAVEADKGTVFGSIGEAARAGFDIRALSEGYNP